MDNFSQVIDLSLAVLLRRFPDVHGSESGPKRPLPVCPGASQPVPCKLPPCQPCQPSVVCL